MSKGLRVAGDWLDLTVGRFSELTNSTRFGGGDWEISWKMQLPIGARPRQLRPGALVEVMDGPWVLRSGYLTEPNWVDGTFAASGFCREAEQLLAFDSALNSTLRADVAVDRGAVRGWRVTRDATVPTTALGAADTGEGLNYIAAVLDAAADQAGKFWTVRADRAVRFETAPTTPTLHIKPGVAQLGVVDQDYCRTVYVAYCDSGDRGKVKKVSATDASAPENREVGVDATVLLPITTAKAQSMANGILAKGKAKWGWTGTIELGEHELYSDGGERVDLWSVQAGQMARVHGAFDDQVNLSGATSLDVVLGDTSHVDESGVISVSPIGTVKNSLQAAIEQALSVAA